MMDSPPSKTGVKETRLKMLENLLQCSICFEQLQTSMMITQCSHNYCSLCIRKYFSYKKECPSCSMPATDGDLVKNRQLDEIVQHFKYIKEALLQGNTSAANSKSHDPQTSQYRSHDPQTSQQRSRDPQLSHDNNALQTKSHVRHASTKQDSSVIGQSQNQTDSSNDFDDVQIITLPFDGGKTPNKEQAFPPANSSSMSLNPTQSIEPAVVSPASSADSTKVTCPVCGVSVKEKHMNQHLDQCLQREQKKEALRRRTPKRKPLPKLVYALMNDKELKRRLKEYKLSTVGDRKTLEKRHHEYTILYNAECDAKQPKSVPEIIREVEKMELNRKRHAKTSVQSKLKFSKDTPEEEMEGMKKNYLKQHKTQFQLLMEDAKQRMKKKRKADGDIPSTETSERTHSNEGVGGAIESSAGTSKVPDIIDIACSEDDFQSEATGNKMLSAKVASVGTGNGERTRKSSSTPGLKLKKYNVLNKNAEVGNDFMCKQANDEKENAELELCNDDDFAFDSERLKSDVGSAQRSQTKHDQSQSGIVDECETAVTVHTNNNVKDSLSIDQSGIEFENEPPLPNMVLNKPNLDQSDEYSLQQELTADDQCPSDNESVASESLLKQHTSPVFDYTPTRSSSVFNGTPTRPRTMSAGSEVDIFDDVIGSSDDVIASGADVIASGADVMGSSDVVGSYSDAIGSSGHQVSSHHSSPTFDQSDADFTIAWGSSENPTQTRRTLRKRKAPVTKSKEPARKRPLK